MRLASLQSNAEILEDKYISLLEFGESRFKKELAGKSLKEFERDKFSSEILDDKSMKIVEGIIKDDWSIFQKSVRADYDKYKNFYDTHGSEEYFDYTSNLSAGEEYYSNLIRTMFGNNKNEWQNEFNEYKLWLKDYIVIKHIDQFLKKLATTNSAKCVFFDRRENNLQSWDKMQSNIHLYDFNFDCILKQFVFRLKAEDWKLGSGFEVYIDRRGIVQLKEKEEPIFNVKAKLRNICYELLDEWIPRKDKEFESKGGLKDNLYLEISEQIRKNHEKCYKEFKRNLYDEQWKKFLEEHPEYEHLKQPGNRHLNKKKRP